MITSKKYKKAFLVLCLIGVTFIGRTLFVKTYNYLEQGLFVNTASGKAMSVATALYVCDMEDGNAIRDEKLKFLFDEIYTAAYKDGMNYQFAPSGIIERERHFESCHEPLNFDYFSIYAREYIREEKGIYVDDFQRLMVEQDVVASRLIKELMPQIIGRYIKNYVGLVVVGFIRSVAFVHPILDVFVIFIYLLAISLCILFIRKKKENTLVYDMATTLLIITGNVTGTAFMIQCISRYMLYNLPIIYIILFLMLLKLFNFDFENDTQER